MKGIQKKLVIGTLCLASLLSGCSRSTHQELLSEKIDGVEIKFVRHEDIWTNKTTMELYDSKGNLKAQLDYGYLPDGFIDSDTDKVDIMNGTITKNKKKNYAEKE